MFEGEAGMTPNAERAAVAREVLTELLEFANARAETVSDTKQFMRERYPAPPAPETVTVGAVNTLRTGTANTLAVTVDRRVWTYDSEDECWDGPDCRLVFSDDPSSGFLHRIASDARELAARDARIAELEREVVAQVNVNSSLIDERESAERERDEARRGRDVAHKRIAELEQTNAQYLVELNAFKTRVTGLNAEVDAKCRLLGEYREERDAARREVEALQERLVAVAPSPALSAEEKQGSHPAPVAPAPIPLGATVEVEGDEDSPYERVTNGWRFARSGDVAYDWDTDTSAPCVTALYRARHPVATRETVERVAEAMWSIAPILADWKNAAECHRKTQRVLARAALRAAGFTVEGA